ncbi:hypothetical protein F7C95_17315 [Opitutia bacterium ISCC 51]|nr:hypothetical protein F7C95_17315 [Opitutae bacterium ISCC 51]QXD27731.1 hypothetical protein GA003_17215 [Opitutae bacterium ISCC 52]
MTDKRISKWAPEKLLKTVTITLMFIIAGPEVWVAVEFVTLIELVGVMTFWTSIWVGFKMMPIYKLFDSCIRLLMKLDPYFFIPDKNTIRQMPSMLVHAVPFAASFLILMMCAP